MATQAKVYRATPTLEQWKKDSSVALVRRSDDTVLMRIDPLFARHEFCGSDDARLQFQSDLFFMLDYWLGVCGHTSGVDSGRKPAASMGARNV
ncbi:MAG: hypothetical protein B7Z14_12395 [Bosea sp. 32-68-6]|nr:MAG: hypothetical protein B7Z14_12395 [Bosea sp. 32-68-6]